MFDIGNYKLGTKGKKELDSDEWNRWGNVKPASLAQKRHHSVSPTFELKFHYRF